MGEALNHHGNTIGALPRLARAMLVVVLAGACLAPLAQAQRRTEQAEKRFSDGSEMVQLDFRDVELAVVDRQPSRKITGKNFIYDDRVRGRVTIVSPTEVTAEQAYRGLRVGAQGEGLHRRRSARAACTRSFPCATPRSRASRRSTTTVRAPTATSSSRGWSRSATSTQRPSPTPSSRWSRRTRRMVAYAPTNTIILTDTESNIRRLLSILDAIDVEATRKSLPSSRSKYADATTLAEQVSEIYGAEVSSGGAETAAQRRTAQVAARTEPADAARRHGHSAHGQQRADHHRRAHELAAGARAPGALDDIRELVQKLDVPRHRAAAASTSTT